MLQRDAPPAVTGRADGYVQDESSQWVAAAVEGAAGEFVLDMCAAPGGKATAIAGDGAIVVAADMRHRRSELVREHAQRLDLDTAVVTGDGTAPPSRPGAFDLAPIHI